MAKREIMFQQQQSIIDGTALGTLQIDLPDSLHQLGSEIEVSANNKILPVYEGKVSFEVTLSDGTVTTFEGSLALWPNKQHSKAALEAVKQAIKRFSGTGWARQFCTKSFLSKHLQKPCHVLLY